MNKIMKNTLSLFAITGVAGLLLGLVYEGTLQTRKDQEIKTQQNAYKTVFKDASEFEDVDLKKADGLVSYTEKEVEVNGIVQAKDQTGTSLGYVVTVTAGEGYDGDIKFSVGVDESGDVTGISYLSISETAGLGMKAKTEEFINQYISGSEKEDGEFIVNKDGENGIVIDAITGATITSRAVTKGVNAACQVAAGLSTGGAANE
ncbi:MAG: FMN-binding protein [Lachnospiraceae bacterium]|nr:FMN-binding protein [Lachnospiraceae bacterium]